CYRRLLAERGREEQLSDFDKFVFWGGMILDDFDDVDRQLVNADKLFKNLKDFKEINADYLDDEQKRVVRQIWGETARTAAVTEFWTHLNNTDEDSIETRFINLWELLGDLYRLFTAQLHAKGFDTAGGQYRDAAVTINNADKEDLSKRHYSFIGFNDLSHSEIMIFKRLKDSGAADFFWDFDSVLMQLAIDGYLASQMRKMKTLFPMPDDFEPAICETLPEIEVMPVPSCIVQTKAAYSVLESWEKSNILGNANAINTAVVLPDENLLTPLLLSIPENVPAVNITMGVPFNSTAFAAMLHSIISMQLRSRVIRGEVYYYYADVIDLLSHPHFQAIAPLDAEKIKCKIDKDKLFNIKATDLCTTYPQLAYLFTPVKNDKDHNEICRYMVNLINGLSDALRENAKTPPHGLPEIDMLNYFSKGITELNNLIESYGITMSGNTYFSLFERLMQSRRIDLQGTPLRGMQVMGVLETRALDFDNIIILSMNENSFPRKSYMRTMIPNNLRIGYGLNTIDRQDSLYTYYFYRLLSRAKRVKLIYDSRTGSFGAGEPSRYISQLLHIAPDGVIKTKGVDINSEITSTVPLSVVKTDAVMKELDNLRSGLGRNNLSASSLKDYHKCRLKFYLFYVKNLRGNNEIEDGIPSSTYGTIVHKVAELLYQPYEGKELTHEIIMSIRNANDYVDNLVKKVILQEFYHKSGIESIETMPPEGSLTASVISTYVKKMLDIDAQLAPFVYKKGEKKVKEPWKINDNLTINFYMAIDRIDIIRPGHLRFIDYKTGADKSKPTTIEKIFQRGNTEDSAIFQLLTYCLAYGDIIENCSIKPLVYPLRSLASENKIPEFKVDNQLIDDYHQIEESFRKNLFDMIEEIFDKDVPFDQAEDNKACKFCPFLDLCNRTEPETFDNF
ncbi:MAG: PD-(D/E)XK nuclease family protein, partial [Muribaculaceae bacterium]|nr:PD-(D/E)XK nuclease family protein [Muribaculaceae bacterium]